MCYFKSKFHPFVPHLNYCSKKQFLRSNNCFESNFFFKINFWQLSINLQWTIKYFLNLSLNYNIPSNFRFLPANRPGSPTMSLRSGPCSLANETFP